jgi:ubiquinone/menaquinone biosynthesis C-methylase UbiE
MKKFSVLIFCYSQNCENANEQDFFFEFNLVFLQYVIIEMMKFETFPTNNKENSTENLEKEPREVYINEVLAESKSRLAEYFPVFYRDIPTNLNYQDNTEELKVNYHFEDENLNINIKTPENLSGKTINDLKRTEGDFLVFQDIAENETISKKTQDFFFLSHEYIHGINQMLFKEYRPDIIKIGKDRKREFAKMDEDMKKEILREESVNSIISILGESLPISLERIMVEKILQDENINDNEKENVRKFWEVHEKSLLSKKLEKDPESKYSELDEAMISYKIYQKFGEKGIIDFIKNFDFDKLSRIRKYSDAENKILSGEYKDILEMNIDEIVENFTKHESTQEQEKTDEEVFRAYVEDLNLKPEDFEGKILDIGSGSGGFAKWAKDHNVSSEIYSVEPFDKAINAPNTVRSYADQLPFQSGEFDLIISNSAIPNVFIGGNKEKIKKQIKGSFDEFLRVSKPNGEIRLGRVQKGGLYENQRNFKEALDEVLNELSENQNLEINEIHKKPDTYEYDNTGNPVRLLAESFLIKIKKQSEKQD